MGRATPLLELLCGRAMSLGAQSIEVEYKDGREYVIATKGTVGISIATYKSSSADAKELLGWWLVPLCLITGWILRMIVDRIAQWWIGRYRRLHAEREA